MRNRRNVVATLALVTLFQLISTVASAAEVWRGAAAYPVGMDTWFGSTYSTSAQHDYRNRIGGWGDEYLTLLRFDLSGLPQLATGAYIWRYTIKEGASTTPIDWYKVTAPWQTSTATYGSFPWSATAYLGTTPAPLVYEWRITNITDLYNQWRAGTSKNYGLLLAPESTSNSWSTIYSSGKSGYNPTLQVVYTPQSTDSVIKLKWPLSTAKPSSPSSAFGADWGNGDAFCAGLPMKHAGVDLPSAAGKPVYAMEDGFVVKVLLASQTGGWASAIVLEHNHPVSGKYTTVYWHVNPVTGIKVAEPGQSRTFVPKGAQIAIVADLTRAGDHLHIGARIGTYDSLYSDKGALPAVYCTQLKTFKENFIDPWNPSQVLFQ